jgi:hypothetical protein
LNGERYYLLIVDDFTRYCFGETICNKYDALRCFKKWHIFAEKQFDQKVKRIRTDNGGEFTSNAFTAYLADHGISRELTAPYTPESNGLVERTNGIMGGYIRSMLTEAQIGNQFWAHAFRHALKLRNVSANKVLQHTTPYERLHGRKPNLNGFRIFGCKVWAQIPEERRKKLSARSKPCILLGHVNERPPMVYELFDPSTGKTFASRHTVFEEDARVPSWTNFESSPQDVEVPDTSFEAAIPWEEPAPEDELPPEVTSAIEHQASLQRDVPTILGEIPDLDADSNAPTEHSDIPPLDQEHTPIVEDVGNLHNSTVDAHANVDDIAENNNEIPLEIDQENEARYPTRVRRPPALLSDYARKATSNPSETTPQTIQQARKRPDWPLWQGAIQAELRSHDANQTWTLIDHPKDKSINIVTCKWVFVIKRKADGSLDKYKARLVARGFTQRYGYDYDETFSPVVKSTTLRLLVGLAAAFQWEIVHWDAITAFLNGKLSVSVYMTCPPGYETPGKVCKLHKAIYGLKQAGREWYIFASKALKAIGFTKIEQDHCLFFLNRPKKRIIVALYVDDIVATAEDSGDLPWLRRQIESHFKITDQGHLSSVLNVKVERHADGIHLSQPGYIDKILERFEMAEAKITYTPLPSGGIAITEDPEPVSEGDRELYQQLVGSVTYLACYTRPDIAFAVHSLSRYNANPTVHALTAAKHLLRYLKTTKAYSLWFPSVTSGRISLRVYTDADFANQKANYAKGESFVWKNGVKMPSDAERIPRKSVTGMIALLNGTPVSWLSKQQPIIATSTQMAEYIAAFEGGKEAYWQRHLLQSLGLWKESPIPLHIDNQAAIQLCRNPVLHKATKHIDTIYHKIREWAADAVIDVAHVGSADQRADMLTKPLNRQQIEETCRCINIRIERLREETAITEK